MDGYAGINERWLSREYKIQENSKCSVFGVSGVERYMVPVEDALCEMVSRQCMRIHSPPSPKAQA